MDRFEQLKIIGRGNYGAAHLVVEKATGKHLVVKKVPISEMSEEERKQASQEVLLLERLEHPNVVKYYGLYSSKLKIRTIGLTRRYVERSNSVKLG